MSDETSVDQGVKDVLTRFSRDVVRSAAVDLVARALTLVGLALLAALALLIWQGGSLSVPAWTIALVLFLAVAATLLARRQISALKRDSNIHRTRVAELESVPKEMEELQEWTDIVEGAVARFEVYTQHVVETLDRLQRVVAGDIDVSIPTYIERGILNPARDILVERPAEHVRLSVLLPDDADECFEMYFAAGHSIAGQSKYRVPIKDTLSRIAYETGEDQEWRDVMTDDRFVQNPEATWPTRSMVSLPLRYGDEVIGVFNAISSQPGSFDPAEHAYLASLASVISVAVGVEQDRHNPPDNDDPGL